ncbi:PREDICTED: uncharacterized protein LOC104603153 isoform X2 [Nelumbo nucifera]|uniref:Bifunctional lysine-specific demethylase and histidyl-hydroxylase n=1 Tax=Nelumbo nucifera TaxID=4432 RepID=A0A1U8ARL7_NELNU|nr:PREDICTED: uncharacterized protein LOC104603153 isoform X2 [Nelumbo nucifera]
MGMGKRRKRKKRSLYDQSSMDTILFPLMLAALAKLDNPFCESLLKKCLKKLQLSLLTQTPNSNIPPSFPQKLSNDFLSFLPALLRSKNPEIASRTAEIVGAATLLSLDMNERVVSDAEILKGLVAALSSGSKRISMAACNAVLDVSTTLIGRTRLCDFCVVEKLITDTRDSISPRIGLTAGKLPILVLYTAVTLINSCNLKNLSKIPRELRKTFLNYLKELWRNVWAQMLLIDIVDCSQGRYYFSNLRTNHLAESIFRLSIDLDQNPIACIFELVKKSMFGPSNSDFEQFMLCYWEDSPCLLRNHLQTSNDHEDIFNPLVQSLNCKGTVDSLLSSILCNLVSCPPICSDEFDILVFLEEVRDKLGCPMIYGQDIRVIKAVEEIYVLKQGSLKKEVHFFKQCMNSFISGPKLIDAVAIQQCKEAHREGYTISLRGMEFRSEYISAIADSLAALFGQPSVGANLYLTPPQSQGLARHYDDHCVFVCQLLGTKKWTVFSRPTVQLPRLYEPLDCILRSEDDCVESKHMQFLLSEGDILYIPRGCPHEACTVTDNSVSTADDGSTGFSLHLTLGVEVEPPFEWEGFAHVALHCWNHNHKRSPDPSSLMGTLNFISVYMLHVAIRLIGDHDPKFRKACMVAAIPLHSLDLNRKMFSYVINKIDRESRYLEVFNRVQAAIGNNEDIWKQMKWIQHLFLLGEMNDEIEWNYSLTEFRDYISYRHMEVEDAFVQLKSKFCRDISFEDACQSFNKVLEKYKKTRKQYMSGMLSLHCT